MKQLFLITLLIMAAMLCACHSTDALSEDSDDDYATDDSSNTDTESGTGNEFLRDSETESTTHPETDSETETPVITPRSGQSRALLAIIDNAQSMEGSTLESLYNQYPDEIGTALADLYGVPLADIQSRTLTEVSEDYGENWIIENVMEQSHAYDITVFLTDTNATSGNFLDAIKNVNDEGFLVDILIDLHGSPSGDILFYDGSYPVDEITGTIQAKKMAVSTVYQTTCYGSDMMDAWTAIGVHAVNGGVGDNMYVNFAPGAFFKNWINGMSFEDAVQQARLDDMTEMQTRLNAAAEEWNNAELLLLLSIYNFNTQSLQIVDGAYPQIAW
ncbi:MAG: hypothetical protein JXX29_01170 [Deltaproteobacteria bacterium]|nr:hypothetical protein [Deltaproteobacteria bacterium]